MSCLKCTSLGIWYAQPYTCICNWCNMALVIVNKQARVLYECGRFIDSPEQNVNVRFYLPVSLFIRCAPHLVWVSLQQLNCCLVTLLHGQVQGCSPILRIKHYILIWYMYMYEGGVALLHLHTCTVSNKYVILYSIFWLHEAPCYTCSTSWGTTCITRSHMEPV